MGELMGTAPVPPALNVKDPPERRSFPSSCTHQRFFYSGDRGGMDTYKYLKRVIYFCHVFESGVILDGIMYDTWLVFLMGGGRCLSREGCDGLSMGRRDVALPIFRQSGFNPFRSRALQLLCARVFRVFGIQSRNDLRPSPIALPLLRRKRTGTSRPLRTLVNFNATRLRVRR